MKIAVSTQDGLTICGHLGKCKTFLVYETDGDRIVGKGLVKAGGTCPGHGHSGHGEKHGVHNVSPFKGCDAVITQGMGQGMLHALAMGGIRPVITGLSDPDEAVRRLLCGELCESKTSSCSCKNH